MYRVAELIESGELMSLLVDGRKKILQIPLPAFYTVNDMTVFSIVTSFQVSILPTMSLLYTGAKALEDIDSRTIP